ncbi:Tektin-5 [Amphibalanus amphitrite]|uniref:Tektin n=1 Tax=Amphibalanus amphitrite TaxID=1232801 RepID=A0A6A4WPE2_AMPAM|nr:Tektin-5 [Amphibalanus amphitrite]
MCRLLQRIAQTLQELRDARNCLERDALDKFATINIDKYAHGLNNNSPGIALYPGIEQWDKTMSTPESWLDFTIRLAWNNTNEALAQRIQQTTDMKNRMQAELSRLTQELADQEKHRQALQKALGDKCPPLKVAHTRLERRTHRPCMELCRDNAMIRLQGEVLDLYGSIDQLKQKLAAVEATIAALLSRKNRMEDELQIKTNSLLIDRERVLGARRAFPITSVVTKCQ